MVYVMSDLHGYPMEKLLNILESIEFSEKDFLYVLGDVIDRGKDGIKIIKWLMQRRNTKLLLGNHELMLLKCEFMFEEEFDPFGSSLYGQKRADYALWSSNGGITTIDALNGTRSSELKYIFDYLKNAPLYAEINVNGRDFVLTHSGLGNFKPEKKLSEYTATELLWERPSLNTEYFENIFTIFGHTPTLGYGNEHRGKAVKTRTWMNIDAGVAAGLSPMVLRLDDLKEFYFDL